MNTIYRMILLCCVAFGIVGCASQGKLPPTAKIERMTAEDLAQLAPASKPNITLDALVYAANQGATADELIEKIKASHSYYDLTPEQSLALNKQGLDIKVLNYIHQANTLAKQNVIADEMNKRQKEQLAKQRLLRYQRDLERMRYSDPWSMYYRYPWVGPLGFHPYQLRYRRFRRGFGLGLNYGW